jgi:hypothetical protein
MLELGQGYHRLGRLQLGDGVSQKGDRAAAVQSFERAQALFERVPIEAPEGATARRDGIRLLADVGNVTSDPALVARARDLGRAWLDAQPGSRDAAIAFAASLVCEVCDASDSTAFERGDLLRAAETLDAWAARAPPGRGSCSPRC